MEFDIVEDNGGSYHWRIIAGNGGSLVQSVSLASTRTRSKPHAMSAMAWAQRASRPAPAETSRWISSCAVPRLN